MTARDATSKRRWRDRLLVLRCQAGDDEAFAELYRRHADGLRGYVRGFLEPEAADDVLQEVWLTVLRRIRDVTNPDGFRTWLFRTARHRAIDALRTDRRREALAATVAGSEARGGAPEDRMAFEAAIAGLSPEHREAIRLRFFEDLTYTEIASVVGCPLGTVRSRIHQARARLRDELGD